MSEDIFMSFMLGFFSGVLLITILVSILDVGETQELGNVICEEHLGMNFKHFSGFNKNWILTCKNETQTNNIYFEQKHIMS